MKCLIVLLLAVAVCGCPTPPIQVDVAETLFALIKAQHDYGIGEVPAELWAESQALIVEYRASADQARRWSITIRLGAIKAEVCPLKDKELTRALRLDDRQRLLPRPALAEAA